MSFIVLNSVDASLPLILTSRLVFDNTTNKGKQGVILTDTHIITRVNTGTPLPDQDGPGIHKLPGISLYSKPLGITVPTITSGAAPLFMCHLPSPILNQRYLASALTILSIVSLV